MRDPDLVQRAEAAAAELERAWYCWRATHGLVTDPMPTVSSYVGYSLEEPWGQPRVVFGIAAEDAEQLAGLLVRHDSPAGSARASVAAGQAGREPQARRGDRAGQAYGGRAPARVLVPPQASSAVLAWGEESAARAYRDVVDDDDGPVFREITAVRRRAIEEPDVVSDRPASEELATALPDVAVRDVAEREVAVRDVAVREVAVRDVAERDVAERDVAERDVAERDVAVPDVAVPDVDRAGSWAMAASAARAETEARIRASQRSAVSTAGHQAQHADTGSADTGGADTGGADTGSADAASATDSVRSDGVPPAESGGVEPTLVTGFSRLDEAAQVRFHAGPDLTLAWDEPEFSDDRRADADATSHRAAGAEHLAGADPDADHLASDRPDAERGAHARRGRLTRGHAMSKLSKVKRPGAVPGL